MTTYYNHVTKELITLAAHELTDEIAMQLIRQDRATQDIYVYARKCGASIGEALSRALLDGKRQKE